MTRKKQIQWIAGLLLFCGVVAQAQTACINWGTSLPQEHKADAGFALRSGVEHYLVFAGSEPLGMFNQHPAIGWCNNTLMVAWPSHEQYENTAGTRILYSFSKDLEFWSDTDVLFDSIGTMSSNQTGTVLYNPSFEQGASGDWYAIAEVADLDNGDLSVDGIIAKCVDLSGVVGSNVYWLSNSIPSEYSGEGFLSVSQLSGTLKTDMEGLVQMFADRVSQYALPTASGDAECGTPAYFTRSDGKEVGVYQDLNGGMRLLASLRDSVTNAWPEAQVSDIPDSPAKTAAGNLPDGRSFLIGNFLDEPLLRDPLMLALSDDGISFDNVHSLRAGASPARREYPGGTKDGGFQGPDAEVINGDLWTAYSISKEQIAISRIRLVSNFLENGGFESGSSTPYDWSPYVTANADSIYITNGVASDTVYIGERAVAISNPEGSVERWYVRNDSAIEAMMGETYILSAWVKTEDITTEKAYVRLDFLDSNYARVDYKYSAAIDQDQDWSLLSVTNTVSSGVSFLRPMLVVDGDAGSNALITFDECTLTVAP